MQDPLLVLGLHGMPIQDHLIEPAADHIPGLRPGVLRRPAQRRRVLPADQHRERVVVHPPPAADPSGSPSGNSTPDTPGPSSAAPATKTGPHPTASPTNRLPGSTPGPDRDRRTHSQPDPATSPCLVTPVSGKQFRCEGEWSPV